MAGRTNRAEASQVLYTRSRIYIFEEFSMNGPLIYADSPALESIPLAFKYATKCYKNVYKNSSHSDI